MLSGEGNAGERWKTKQLVLSAKKQLCTCSTLYCTFLCRCLARLGPHDYNVKLPEISLEEMFLFTFFHCRSFSPCIWLVVASISYNVTATTKFSCCSSNKKMSLFLPLFIDVGRPFSLWASLACRLLSLFLCLSLALYSTNPEIISAFRFRLYWLFSCLCFTRLRWLCYISPK